MKFHDLITIPIDLYFRIALILYEDMTIFARCSIGFMLSCSLMFGCDANLDNVGG